jgi:hypothetical protein
MIWARCSVAQRRRQQAGTGGGADQGEGRQRQGDGAGARSLAEDDGELTILHRRVERLLDRPPEPVDLIDEEDAAWLQRGEEGGDIGLALQRRAGGLHQRHAHLLGDDVGKRGLAEARRPGEQDVIERLVAPPRRLDEDRQLLGDLLLVDEVGEGSRSQRAVEVLIRSVGPGVVHADVLGRRLVAGRKRPVDPGRADAIAHALLREEPALRRAAARSCSASSPSMPTSSCSASKGA